jgi:cytochrome P450
MRRGSCPGEIQVDPAVRGLTAAPGPCESDFDPFDVKTLDHPYDSHASMRDSSAVHFLTRYGTYALFRYEDVKAALSDWNVFSSAAGAGLGDIRRPDAWRPGGPIVEVDPPVHTSVRRALMRILSPAVIRAWRAEFVRKAEVLAEQLIQQRSLDGVVDVAEPYIFDVFPAALGMRSRDDAREKLLRIGELNFEGMGPKNERFAEAERKMAPFAEWYESSFQRANMVDGGFGAQIFEAGDRGEIDPAIAPGLVRSFLRGGMDTTIATIGHTLWLLATRPAQWAAVRKDLSLIKSAFEETMRFETPIQTVYRTTTRRVNFQGVMLEAETKVQLFLGSANRDPRRWREGDVFDIFRQPHGHVALGFGVHNCIGQMLARMEGEAILTALLSRVSHLEMDGEPERRINNNLRSLRRLPLRIIPA